MKADLHVHSWHSTQSGALRLLRSYDCYSDPVEVYRTARARGMDLVTITDHDSIDGCRELLDRCPDAEPFFTFGEEVSCRFPDGDIDVHLGVYGITEALHRELQPLRGNVFETIACLRTHGVFFALNHLFHFYRGQAPLASYLRLALEVPALEARNGAMLPEHNALIEQYACAIAPGWSVVGGSDAHTLRRIGKTWTEVPGATTSDAFLLGLGDGRGRVGGVHGSAATVAMEIYGVIARYMASLVGIGPCSQPAARRVGCLAFSVASLPFQFIPLVAAIRGKARERDAMRQMVRQLEPVLARQAAAPTKVMEVEG
jgi:predicted metal-dependent phosphoesterase TrpH